MCYDNININVFVEFYKNDGLAKNVFLFEIGRLGIISIQLVMIENENYFNQSTLADIKFNCFTTELFVIAPFESLANILHFQ